VLSLYVLQRALCRRKRQLQRILFYMTPQASDDFSSKLPKVVRDNSRVASVSHFEFEIFAF
jgi:hypothetical protein